MGGSLVFGGILTTIHYTISSIFRWVESNSKILRGVKGLSFYLGWVMVMMILTNNVREIVQNRPKYSFSRGESTQPLPDFRRGIVKISKFKRG